MAAGVNKNRVDMNHEAHEITLIQVKMVGKVDNQHDNTVLLL